MIMKQLIKNGKVHSFSNGKSQFLFKDIIISGNEIAALGGNYEERFFDKIIDANNCIVIPGIVNAHLHSHDHFNKGGFDNLPLELWLLALRPTSTGMTHTADEIYLRTLYGCIEMFKTGTTTIIDDITQTNIFDEEKIDAVFKAYDTAGIRGFITTMTLDKGLDESVPYLNGLLSIEEKKIFKKMPIDIQEICNFQEKIIKQRKDKIMQYAISPSLPHRCRDDLFLALSELSKRYKVPAVCHVLESRVQSITGQYFYGKSLFEHMKQMGALHEYFNIIHAIHVNIEDIKIMKEFDCKVVHNPVSNLKLGSGLCPLREIMDAGISIGLGTDNTSCNDTINMLETMKFTATLHKIKTNEYREWIGAEHAFKMATVGGATCALMEDKIGTIEVGKMADLAIIDTNNYKYIPSSNVLNSLVFCDNGASVKHLLINGKVVMENAKILTFSEEDILAEIKDLMPRILAENDLAKKEAIPLISTVDKAYRKACANSSAFAFKGGPA
jgi:5-methylthioadenosine/S-adenosylhomocysteine deaminase